MLLTQLGLITSMHWLLLVHIFSSSCQSYIPKQIDLTCIFVTTDTLLCKPTSGCKSKKNCKSVIEKYFNFEKWE